MACAARTLHRLRNSCRLHEVAPSVHQTHRCREWGVDGIVRLRAETAASIQSHDLSRVCASRVRAPHARRDGFSLQLSDSPAGRSSPFPPFRACCVLTERVFAGVSGHTTRRRRVGWEGRSRARDGWLCPCRRACAGAAPATAIHVPRGVRGGVPRRQPCRPAARPRIFEPARRRGHVPFFRHLDQDARGG
jgi:hypothetical protein